MIQRTPEEAAFMSHAQLYNPDSVSSAIRGVEIDSRKIEPGNLYVPIEGARADGHSFIEQVKEKGAAASFWKKDHLPYPVGIPLLVVDDPVKAMQDLAASYLKEVDPYTIGVTGSNGKTSTKDFLAGIFSQSGKTHKTMGNHNNEIGLPLTILDMDEDTQVLVLEMGMEFPGDLPFLGRIAPLDMALIVSIGSAHMEHFGSRKEIARGKLEILSCLKDGGILIWNSDSEELQELTNEIEIDPSVQTISFGSRGDYALEGSPVYTTDGMDFQVKNLGDFHIEAIGDFQAMNALAAIAAGSEKGLEAVKIRQGLLSSDMTKNRGALLTLGPTLILDDSYKSNPEGVEAAMEALMKLPAKKHVAILADMLDLGEEENALHENVGKKAGELGVDALYLWGERSKYTKEGFSGPAQWFETKTELLDAVSKLYGQDAAILIKGSHFFAMDEVVYWFKALHEKKQKSV